MQIPTLSEVNSLSDIEFIIFGVYYDINAGGYFFIHSTYLCANTYLQREGE